MIWWVGWIIGWLEDGLLHVILQQIMKVQQHLALLSLSVPCKAQLHLSFIDGDVLKSNASYQKLHALSLRQAVQQQPTFLLQPSVLPAGHIPLLEIYTLLVSCLLDSPHSAGAVHTCIVW